MRLRPHDVPKFATGRTFLGRNGKKGDYWVWKSRNSYYWVALGNCGEEETEDAAMEAARRYIRGEKVRV